MPLMPLGSYGPPWSQGPRNIRYARKVSAPQRSTWSSGATTLPRDLLMRWPSGPEDLALVEQPPHRLIDLDDAHVARGLREEARVEQVHDGVLGAAGVLVDGQPLAR